MFITKTPTINIKVSKDTFAFFNSELTRIINEFKPKEIDTTSIIELKQELNVLFKELTIRIPKLLEHDATGFNVEVKSYTKEVVISYINSFSTSIYIKLVEDLDEK